MTPREFGELTENDALGEDFNLLSARISAIRQALGESGAEPRLILSRRVGGYALCWPAQYSWIWIERPSKCNRAPGASDEGGTRA